MSIEIDASMVRRAGEEVLMAKCLLDRGRADMAKANLGQARKRLTEESHWQAPGRAQVQKFLNCVIGLEQDLLSLDTMDLSVPAAMIYFDRRDFSAFCDHHLPAELVALQMKEVTA